MSETEDDLKAIIYSAYVIQYPVPVEIKPI